MLAISVFLLFSVTPVSAKTHNPRDDPVAQFFTQAVDHANQQNTDTFLQRYWQQDAWWNPTPSRGKPLVILEVTSFASPTELVNSAVATWAKSLGAMIMLIESRFTGKSFPEPGLNTSSLQYDTVDQHIQDLVSFIVNRTTVLGLDKVQARWVLVGSFFEGAYTTWFRSRYPALAFGSISVSPFLVAVAENKDFDKAYQDFIGPTCAAALHDVVYSVSASFNSFNAAQKLAYEANAGCSAAKFDQDAEFFYVMAMLLIGNLYQPAVCANITAASQFSPAAKMQNLASLMNSLFIQSGAPCEGWDIAKDTKGQGFRSSFYLMCAQLGQFQTPSTSSNALIAPQVDRAWYLGVCQSLFNHNLPPEPNVALFNAAHGGGSPQGCNMVFVSSLNDPYRALGPDASSITRASATNQVISVQCPEPLVGLSVLLAPSGSDKPCVSNARNQIFSILQKWQAAPEACPVPKGGDGDGDDTTTAVVGTVVGIFGILVGIVIGGVAVFYGMRHAYYHAKRYAWTKLN